jgi:hypothetical protein
MAGAQLWLLHDTARPEVFGRAPHGIGLMAHYCNEVLRRQGLDARQNMRDEGTTGQGMQDLGDRGIHAGAFAGGEDNDCKRG